MQHKSFDNQEIKGPQTDQDAPPWLDLLPDELEDTVFDFLEKKAPLLVDKRLYKKTKNHLSPNLYYAVGNDISLYETAGAFVFDNFITYTQEHIVTSEDITQSLAGNHVLLFKDYESAKEYTVLNAEKTYHAGFDIFLPESMQAIFVVELLDKAPYHFQPVTLNVTESIPPCPMPPAPKTGTFETFKTSADNIKKVCFAKFSGRLFDLPQPEGSFNQIWDQAIKQQTHDLSAALVNATKVIFSQYFVWHSRITRHHHDKIHAILATINHGCDAATLKKLINDHYKKAKANNAIKKTGTYFLMLLFVKEQLTTYTAAQKLPGMTNYFGA